VADPEIWNREGVRVGDRGCKDGRCIQSIERGERFRPPLESATDIENI